MLIYCKYVIDNFSRLFGSWSSTNLLLNYCNIQLLKCLLIQPGYDRANFLDQKMKVLKMSAQVNRNMNLFLKTHFCVFNSDFLWLGGLSVQIPVSVLWCVAVYALKYLLCNCEKKTTTSNKLLLKASVFVYKLWHIAVLSEVLLIRQWHLIGQSDLTGLGQRIVRKTGLYLSAWLTVLANSVCFCEDRCCSAHVRIFWAYCV